MTPFARSFARGCFDKGLSPDQIADAAQRLHEEGLDGGELRGLGKRAILDDYAAWREEHPWLSLGADIIPGVGAVTQGGQALHNFSHGNILRGLANVGVAGVNLLGAGALYSGLRGGAQAASGAAAAVNAAGAASKGGKVIKTVATAAPGALDAAAAAAEAEPVKSAGAGLHRGGDASAPGAVYGEKASSEADSTIKRRVAEFARYQKQRAVTVLDAAGVGGLAGVALGNGGRGVTTGLGAGIGVLAGQHLRDLYAGRPRRPWMLRRSLGGRLSDRLSQLGGGLTGAMIGYAVGSRDHRKEAGLGSGLWNTGRKALGTGLKGLGQLSQDVTGRGARLTGMGEGMLQRGAQEAARTQSVRAKILDSLKQRGLTAADAETFLTKHAPGGTLPEMGGAHATFMRANPGAAPNTGRVLPHADAQAQSNMLMDAAHKYQSSRAATEGRSWLEHPLGQVGLFTAVPMIGETALRQVLPTPVYNPADAGKEVQAGVRRRLPLLRLAAASASNRLLA